MNTNSPAISSPCILVCVIDENTRYCFGCGRTGVEIAEWAGYEESKRLDIMAGLELRLETIVRKPRRETRRRKMQRLAGNANTGEPQT